MLKDEISKPSEWIRTFLKTDYSCKISLSEFVICESSYLNISRLEPKENYSRQNTEKAFFCEKSEIFISLIHVCDNKVDCYYGEDELNCQLKKNYSRFQCFDRSKDIPISFVCNYFDDCPDKSDELYCGEYCYIHK